MPSTWRPCSICSSERSLDGYSPGAAEQQPVALFARHRLDPRHDLDEERVHQIGNDDAEGMGAPERQRSGDGVGAIAELLHFGQNPGRGSRG